MNICKYLYSSDIVLAGLAALAIYGYSTNKSVTKDVIDWFSSWRLHSSPIIQLTEWQLKLKRADLQPFTTDGLHLEV